MLPASSGGSSLSAVSGGVTSTPSISLSAPSDFVAEFGMWAPAWPPIWSFCSGHATRRLNWSRVQQFKVYFDEVWALLLRLPLQAVSSVSLCCALLLYVDSWCFLAIGLYFYTFCYTLLVGFYPAFIVGHWVMLWRLFGSLLIQLQVQIVLWSRLIADVSAMSDTTWLSTFAYYVQFLHRWSKALCATCPPPTSALGLEQVGALPWLRQMPIETLTMHRMPIQWMILLFLLHCIPTQVGAFPHKWGLHYLCSST